MLVVLLATATLGGCTTTAFQDPDVKLARDIADLQRRLVELQKKTVVAEVEILRLREKVAELEAARERQLTASDARQAASAPPSSRALPTAQPVTTAPVPAPIETTDLDAPSQFDAPEPTEYETEAEQPTSDSGSSTSAGSASNPTERPSDGVASRTGDATESTGDALDQEPEPLPLAAQALYDRGFTEYHEGRYLEAEASLQQFLEGFPDSEWSDNALYWIGEARYARRDYRGALAAFRETTNRFPLGNKVPDALLKSGQSLEQLGDVASARQSYREIVRRYPNTATALIAQERLEQLSP